MHVAVRRTAVIGAMASTLFLGVGAATASAGTHPHNQAPTGACVITGPNCDEFVAAISGDPTQARNPEADTGVTYTGPNAPLGQSGGSVSADTQNNLQDGTQDSGLIVVGFVPYFGPASFGLTNFDKFNYGGSILAEAQYEPFGIDTNLCYTVNHYNNIVLRPCVSSKRQVFIVTEDAPGVNSAPYPYNFLLSVVQSKNLQHHLGVQAPNSGNGQLVASNVQNRGPLQPSGWQFASINS